MLQEAKKSFKHLQSWLDRGGMPPSPHIYVKYHTSDWRGMTAKVPIKEGVWSHHLSFFRLSGRFDRLLPLRPFCDLGTVLVRVIKEYLILDDTARNSTIGRALQMSNCQPWSSHSYIASFLLEQKALGKDSFWYPYMQVLPAKVDLPMYYSADERKWLKGSHVLNVIKEQVRARIEAGLCSLRDDTVLVMRL